MNKSGGGVVSFRSYNSDEMRLFNGGLRHVPRGQMRLEFNKNSNMWDSHKHLSYERGTVVHSRSPFNQFFNYHFMYGGNNSFMMDRYILNYK